MIKRIISLGILGIACTVFAGDRSPENSSGLTVDITLPQSEVCIGEKLIHLVATIHNTSDKAVDFSPDGARYFVSYTKLDGTFGGNTVNSIREIQPAQWITLQPSESSVVPFVENIDEDFFNDKATYSVSIYFALYQRYPDGFRQTGSVHSNSVEWRMVDCLKH